MERTKKLNNKTRNSIVAEIFNISEDMKKKYVSKNKYSI